MINIAKLKRDKSYKSNRTRRSISPGAEEMLGKLVKVHDLGSVTLTDYSKNDKHVADSARVSYQMGTRAVSDDTKLVRHLKRNTHTSPFEQAGVTFHMKMSLVDFAQLIRHRTAKPNVESRRYSLAPDEFYIPELGYFKYQDTKNKQGGGELMTPEEAKEARQIMIDACEYAFEAYQKLIDMNTARETARRILPQTIYTSFVWTCDLHNLMHFLRLRMDPHAQQEIRDYANVMAEIVKAAFPLSYQAFEDYVLKAETFTLQDQMMLEEIIKKIDPDELKDNTFAYLMDSQGITAREVQEFKDKIIRMGLTRDET